MVDKKGDVDKGLSIELLKTKNKKWLYDGISLDVYGSNKKVGIGVAKDIYKNDFVEFDMGLVVAKDINNFFKSPVNVNIGFSGTWKW